jgi:hypothetical protein
VQHSLHPRAGGARLRGPRFLARRSRCVSRDGIPRASATTWRLSSTSGRARRAAS